MEITDITIKRITPNKGHIGFASCVIGNSLKLCNIAIFTRLSGGYRLVFPEKKYNDQKIPLFFPMNKEFYYHLEQEITSKL